MIFITGFHHSGTSILAKTVEQFGFNFGEPLDRHHENEDLKKIDELVVPNWMDMKHGSIEDGVKAVDLVGSMPAGIDAYKNPRLMMTALLWNKKFSFSKWIVIDRKKEDVIISMMADKTRPQDPIFWDHLMNGYEHMFTTFAQENLFERQDHALLRIDYEMVCAYPELYAKKIGMFLGRPEKAEEVGAWMRATWKLKTYAQSPCAHTVV